MFPLLLCFPIFINPFFFLKTKKVNALINIFILFLNSKLFILEKFLDLGLDFELDDNCLGESF